MKKFNFMRLMSFACMALMLGFSSCKEDDAPNNNNGGGGSTPAAAAESWTVMFYSVGGGNLDQDQLTNIKQAFQSTAYSNINMTFQFKVSKKLQADAETPSSLKGVVRWDLAEQRANVGTIADDDSLWLNRLKTTQISADTAYDMTISDRLADFITYSKNLHPADHYMLILSDHGSGWNVDGDVAETRAILADDNVGKELSLNSLLYGVKLAMGSKKLDLIYDDACLMSAIENIYAYKDIANYFMGAEELTPGPGGEYTQLLNRIAENSNSTSTWANSYCDWIVANRWQDQGCADIGVYDLSKVETLMAPIKQLAEQIVTDASGENADAIFAAMCQTQVAQSTDYSKIDDVPDSLFKGTEGGQALQKNAAGEVTLKRVQDYFKNNNIYALCGNPESLDAQLDENLVLLIKKAGTQASYGVTLSVLMSKLAAAGVNDAAYKTIHDNFVAALKNVAHIASTKASTNDPYEYNSPSIYLCNLTDAGIKQCDGNTVGTFFKMNAEGTGLIPLNANYSSLNDDAHTAAKCQAAYQSTAFNSATGWLNVLTLQNLPNPGLFWNTSLEDNVK